MIAPTPTLHGRWQGASHVGAAKPTQTVTVQPGYMQRKYDTDGHWTAVWTADEAAKELPVTSVGLEWSFDSNGIQTATIDASNVYANPLGGGTYHRFEQGWFSPLRAWKPPKRNAPLDRFGKRVTPNQWDRVLGEAAMVTVTQGYGDQTLPVFCGLVDTVNGKSKPSALRLTARDMGLLLTDCHVFGWNIDPKLTLPVTFVDIGHLKRLEASNSAANRKLAKHYRKVAIVIRDVTDIARTALRWAGFPKGSLRVEKAGTSITRTITFAPGEYLIDLVKKVQDATGMTFFIGHPTPDWPLGRPTLRMSHATWVAPDPVEEVRDDQLLTDFQWQHTSEGLAGIIRVRGKELPASKGGRVLGSGDVQLPSALMAVYRPPWHRFERDARLIRHVVHSEPLLTTQRKCAVHARLLALQEAIAANTGTFEMPGHPGLELDDVVGLVDRASGINSRLGVMSLQSSFTKSDSGTEWKQTVGCALLDVPDVVQVVDELGPLLRSDRSRLYPTVSASGAIAFGSL